MGLPFEELVEISGDAGPFLERVKEAVHWVAETDVGQKLLEDARALNNKPILVQTTKGGSKLLDGGGNIGGYINFMSPMVIVEDTHFNAQGVAPGVLIDHAGNPLDLSLERFFAHEFTHAGQKDGELWSQAYNKRTKELLASLPPRAPQVVAKMDDAFKAFSSANANAIPTAVEAKDRTAIEKLVEGFVNEHADTIFQNYLISPEEVARINNDDVVKAYHQIIEFPAIESENAIAKLRGEEARMMGYAEGKSPHTRMHYLRLMRDKFTDEIMAGKKAIPAPKVPTPTYSSAGGGGGWSSYVTSEKTAGASQPVSSVKSEANKEGKSWIERLSPNEQVGLLMGSIGLGGLGYVALNKKRKARAAQEQNSKE